LDFNPDEKEDEKVDPAGRALKNGFRQYSSAKKNGTPTLPRGKVGAPSIPVLGRSGARPYNQRF